MNETPSSSASFDPARAARLRSQTLDTFQANGRSVARVLYAFLLICLVFAFLAMELFFATTNVQSWILYGVLFLVMFETTVLMKLWYWVINTKLGILREVKLLRMDLAVQKGSMDSLEELARVDAPTRTHDLPRWERTVWLSAVVIVSMLVGIEIGTRGDLGNPLMPFKSSLLDAQGDVALNQTAPQSIPFKPTREIFNVRLRADTQHGTITFDIFAPDGRRIGSQKGAIFTVNHWVLPAPEAGTYTLKVTPNEAAGHWRVRIDQSWFR